jgi:serine protease Do
MKARCILTLALLALAGWVLQSNLAAGDKKEKEKEPDKKAEPAKPVVVSDALINADLKDKVNQQSYCKTFTFKMTKGKSYQIDLTSAAFRPFLRLENAAGNQIASDFDRFGNGQGATIVHRPTQTEDVEIVATSLNGNATGKFTITIRELTGKEGAPIELKLEKGTVTHNGSLAKADPRYNGKIHKLFIVKMEEGKTYQIDHMSRNFDAYLYLQGPDGKVLAEDDDGGEGLNSRIIHRAGKTGEYRIVATSLAGSQTGAFTFIVTEKK